MRARRPRPAAALPTSTRRWRVTFSNRKRALILAGDTYAEVARRIFSRHVLSIVLVTDAAASRRAAVAAYQEARRCAC